MGKLIHVNYVIYWITNPKNVPRPIASRHLSNLQWRPPYPTPISFIHFTHPGVTHSLLAICSDTRPNTTSHGLLATATTSEMVFAVGGHLCTSTAQCLATADAFTATDFLAPTVTGCLVALTDTNVGPTSANGVASTNAESLADKHVNRLANSDSQLWAITARRFIGGYSSRSPSLSP